MKKVCVCAHFGEGKELLNGQSVKAQIITKEIEKKFGKDQVVRIDSHGGIFSFIRLFFQILKALMICRNIVIMPGANGLKFFVPVIWFFNILLKRKIHYVAVGGWLHEYLQNHKFIMRRLYKCKYIYVQTKKMKTDLESDGFKNIIILPNCKDLYILSEDELVYNSVEPYKLCTFSRVLKEKGIEDAIEAVTAVNMNSKRTVYSLDIYGQVDENYRERFENLKKTFPDYIKYGGSVPFDKTTDTIKNYFALVFPTYYEGEGFAGCLIDAYSSGVPVISSDWKYNGEFVDDEVGYLFKTNNITELTLELDRIKEKPEVLNSKKTACLKRAHCYTNEAVLGILINNLD